MALGSVSSDHINHIKKPCEVRPQTKTEQITISENDGMTDSSLILNFITVHPLYLFFFPKDIHVNTHKLSSYE